MGEPNRLRILTFNIWGLAWPFSQDLAGRVRAIGASLGELEVDVAAFQEVWSEAARKSLIDAGRAAGLHEVWHRETALSGSGLLVLSRLPIEAARFDRFELRGLPEEITHADYYGGKGFVRIQVRTDSGSVAIFNTHLQALYGLREQDIYISHRVGQVVEIAEAVQRETLPVVAVGDFNFEERFDEFEILTQLTGLNDVAAELDRREFTINSQNPYREPNIKPDARIDYVFERPAPDRALKPLSIERVLDGRFELEGRSVPYSDHAGLLAEFELTSRSTRRRPVSESAIGTARHWLEKGQVEALERSRRLEATGSVGLLAAALVWFAARRPSISRRRFLRLGCLGVSGATGLWGASRLGLAFETAPDEFGAYTEMLRRLEELARRSRA